MGFWGEKFCDSEEDEKSQKGMLSNKTRMADGKGTADQKMPLTPCCVYASILSEKTS